MLSGCLANILLAKHFPSGLLIPVISILYIFKLVLWRSVKYEKISLEEFETVPELLSRLKEYFEFYNFERLHQSLVGKSPAEIYCGSEVTRKSA